jgi:hypothetical protein
MEEQIVLDEIENHIGSLSEEEQLKVRTTFDELVRFMATHEQYGILAMAYLGAKLALQGVDNE